MASFPRAVLLAALPLAACSGTTAPKDESEDSAPIDEPLPDDTDDDDDDDTRDADGDGYPDDVDCDDTNAAVHPDATEVCNGLDDNCNGDIDEEDATLSPVGLDPYTRDEDGDGFGLSGTEELRCELTDGYAQEDGDCNDTDPTVYPGAEEICASGKDEDCDGLFGEACGVLAIVDDAGDNKISGDELHRAEMSQATADTSKLWVVGFDLDGDGVEDALVGDPNKAVDGGITGAIHVLWGDADRAWSELDDTSPASEVHLAIESSQAGIADATFIATRMAPLDDVDDDGYPDLAMTSVFGAFVIHGGDLSPALLEADGPLPMDALELLAITGHPAPADDVVNIRDVDDDGRVELLVTRSATSSVTLFWGDQLRDNVTGELDVGAGLQLLSGTVQCTGRGLPDTTAGLDLDGDGYSDVAVGCPSTYSDLRGTVLLYAGSDLQAERGSTITEPTADSLCILGEDSGAQLGRLVLSAGDLNFDGYPDLAVANSDDELLIFGGGAERFPSGGDDSGSCETSPLVPGEADVVLTPPGAGTERRSPRSASALEDITGDGIGDLLAVVEAPNNNAGKAVVFAGGAGWTTVEALEPTPFVVQATGGTFLHQGAAVDLGGTGVPSLVFPSVKGGTELRVLTVEGY